MADRLSSIIRSQDTVGRLGGDEFVVLLDPSGTEPSPEMIAERLISVLHEPIEMQGGKTTRVTASIGIALGAHQTADELLRDADLALYSAKNAGKNCYALFDADTAGAA